MANLSATELLVCPVTHERLKAVEQNGHTVLTADKSGRRYQVREGVPSMIPDPVPAALAPHWRTWEQLQDNGLYAYIALPAANTSQDAEETDRALEVFHMSGRVLDIGCGPLRKRPAYVRNVPLEDYVGLDPLLGEQPREFRFVHGIAELLPFPDQSFGAVVFYSSLDHVLDVELALGQAARVLQQGGWINIWMDKEPQEEATTGRIVHFVQRAARQFRAAVRELGILRAIRYVLRLAKLPIPEGARDQFHHQFPKPDEVITVLERMGFGNLESRDLGTEIAFSMQRREVRRPAE